MEAFHFFTKLDQTLLLGLRATTIQELLIGIRSVPDAHFLEVNGYNGEQIRFCDIVFVHDLQPIPQLLIAPSIDPLSDKLGIDGKEQIRNDFLITRHMKDYWLLFLSLFHEGDVVYL